MPNAEPLHFNGIGWPVPRIDPQHFSASQFQAVVHKTVRGDGLEHMWLDVACIDQRRNSPEMACEIGRQATIFNSAKRCFIWLSRHSTPELQEIASQFKSLETVEDVDENTFSSALHTLRHLKEDPWFSSLWTLQESWMKGQAIFLSKSADEVSFGTEAFDLMSLMQASVGLLRRLKGNLRVRLNDKTSSTCQFEELVRTSGFYALTNAINPLGLLAASGLREVRAEEENNRIYAIMQVFGFQLGISALDAPNGKEYALPELEDQMGVALLHDFPLVSQLHVFDSPPVKGTAWHISRHSTIARGLDPICYRLGVVTNHDKRIQFGVRPYNGRLFGYFKGATIAFKHLFEACRRLGPRPRSSTSLKTSGKRRQLLALDRLPLLESRGFSHEHFDRTRYVPHEDAHIGHCQKLLKCLADHELNVLLLGREMFPNHTRQFAVGVLLVKENWHSDWTRIGVFTWFTDECIRGHMSARDRAIVNGEKDHWTVTEGLFG